MSLVGVKRIDDGIPVRKRNGEARRVVNVDVGVVNAVNEYAEGLEERLGFKPTFAQALLYIVNELRKR